MNASTSDDTSQQQQQEQKPKDGDEESAGKQSRMDALANALRRKRRLESQAMATKQQQQPMEKQPKTATETTPETSAAEDQLKKRATEALLREAQRSHERAKTMGPSGYLKPACLQTNKRFLHATVKATMFQPAAAEKQKRTRNHREERRLPPAEDEK